MVSFFNSFIDPRSEGLRLRAAFAIYVAVLVLGSIPGAREEVGVVASGLVLHFATYGTIASLIFTGVPGGSGSRALKTILVIAAMGALDEYIQSFFPYRTSDIVDWTVDLSAGCFASAVWAYWFPRWSRAGGHR